MSTTTNRLIVQATFLWVSILMSSASYASAQTDAEVRNYTDQAISIEYKLVTLTGNVTWNLIGKVSSKRSRLFRKVTIGSVLRAKTGTEVIQEFTVSSPDKNTNKTILTVRK
jgi:hypothetical protein